MDYLRMELYLSQVVLPATRYIQCIIYGSSIKQKACDIDRRKHANLYNKYLEFGIIYAV